MDCREVTEYMLAADNNAPPPAAVRTHLETCPQCSKEFNRFTDAVAALLRDQLDETVADPAITERVMGAVRREMVAVGVEPPTALRSWIIAGTILLAGLLGLRFSEVMSWLRLSFGPAIDIAMSLILGTLLTAYICLLVGSNLDRVRRVLRLR